MKNAKGKSPFRRFLHYYKPHAPLFVLDMFCAVLLVLADVVLPIIAGELTDAAVNDISSITTEFIVRIGVLYLSVRLIDTFANYFMQSVGHFAGAKMETAMRADLFSHLQKLSFSYYGNHKIGQLMSRITSDLFDVTEFAHHCPEMIVTASFKIVVSFIILCTYNVTFALVLLLAIPVMVVIAAQFSKKTHAVFKEQRAKLGEMNARVEDNLLGIRVVKSFVNEDKEIEKFNGYNADFYGIKKRSYHYMATFHSLTRFFDGMMYLIAIVFGIYLVSKGEITIANFTASLFFVSGMLNSIKTLVDFAEQFQRGVTSIDRFYEILDVEPESDKETARELQTVKGEIVFDNVSFHYDDNDKEVLANINLKINAGENVALVGPSGGGKTTFCSLIPRFYHVDRGSISIDGNDVEDLTYKSLRSHIGIVQQDVYMFSGSVYENILYGKADATKEEIERAAHLAGADEFIAELPDGYDTYIGERGVKLSGGQKQRISIARVFLKNPEILILDEATSALDNESERIIQASLEKLSEGRTTVTIAHRLSTIENADRIVVLSADGISEQGTHAELMAKQGAYYKMQTAGKKPDKE